MASELDRSLEGGLETLRTDMARQEARTHRRSRPVEGIRMGVAGGLEGLALLGDVGRGKILVRRVLVVQDHVALLVATPLAARAAATYHHWDLLQLANLCRREVTGRVRCRLQRLAVEHF